MGALGFCFLISLFLGWNVAFGVGDSQKNDQKKCKTRVSCGPRTLMYPPPPGWSGQAGLESPLLVLVLVLLSGGNAIRRDVSCATSKVTSIVGAQHHETIEVSFN